MRKSSQNSVATTTSTATVESISRAKCNIVYHDETGSDDEEYVRAFRISVGNSAGIYSNSVGLMVYDGSCVRASVEGADFKWDVEVRNYVPDILVCLHLSKGNALPVDQGP